MYLGWEKEYSVYTVLEGKTSGKQSRKKIKKEIYETF
jgi:hypothetical protein